MRNKYHIVIEKNEDENFKSILETLKITAELRTDSVSFDANHIDYVIFLSKYELLYMRLTCKTGHLFNLDEQCTDYFSEDELTVS